MLCAVPASPRGNVVLGHISSKVLRVITVRNLSKSFGSKRVLSDVSLDVLPGQIHALLGPNGSGKSTLIRCLSGAIRPDAGVITKDGVAYQSFTPRSANEAGTSVIYQSFSLVPTLSVTDNVFLGDELRTGLRIDRPRERKIVVDELERLGHPLDPDKEIGRLSAGDQQVVEIIKALRREPSLLILDEPTAALGQDEITALAEMLKWLRDQAMAILYVTHLIGEVFLIADYVTVLRDGEVVLTEEVAALEPEQVISAIAPSRRVDDRDREDTQPAGPAEVELVSYTTPGIAPLTLTVNAGEIVGIFGLLGSGRTELLEGIYGIRKHEGTIRLGGKRYRAASPAEALRAGVALVAGERLRQSMFLRLTALDNLLLPHMKRLARYGVRVRSRERGEFDSISGRIGLAPNAPTLPAWTFSGGNQQKIAVGRWLASAAGVRVLLLDEPTQGIDVGARADLYRLVHHLAREERKAIIFTSSDPDETLALADRIVVLRAGAVVTVLSRNEATAERLLTYAHSASEQESIPLGDDP
jgi:ribose transport system ATP-binding protein